jgi:hypothetical protein
MFGVAMLLCFSGEALAQAQNMVIRGVLNYHNNAPSKSFTWSLRFYSTTGIVIGTSNDRDGYAEFFGTYSPRSNFFYMTKHFVRRTTGATHFYYKGRISNNRLVGRAHQSSYWGTSYASLSGSVSWSRWNVTVGSPRRLALTGTLRYTNNTSKAFSWQMQYYASSGRCYGTVRDQDGLATFEGIYDQPTKRFFLRKTYDSNRVFYYTGSMVGSSIVGTARQRSFTDRNVYASWSARLLWDGSHTPPPVQPPVVPPPQTGGSVKRFYLRGTLRYINGPQKSFSWNMRYYPGTGKCFGETFDRDGKALFSGSCDPDTGRISIRKVFTPRKNRPIFFYTGRITRKGANGVARRDSERGQVYANWNAKLVWQSTR